MLAHLDILRQTGIRNADTFLLAQPVGESGNQYPVASGKLQRLIADSGSRTYLRTFRIHQNSDLVRYRPHVIDNPFEALPIEMRRIHPDDIHSIFVQCLDKIHIASFVGNRGNYFSIFRYHIYCF